MTIETIRTNNIARRQLCRDAQIGIASIGLRDVEKAADEVDDALAIIAGLRSTVLSQRVMLDELAK